MKKSRFTEEQIAFTLRQAESGTAIQEITRKLGISEQTFYRWKKKYAGMGIAEQRRRNIMEALCGLTPTWQSVRVQLNGNVRIRFVDGSVKTITPA